MSAIEMKIQEDVDMGLAFLSDHSESGPEAEGYDAVRQAINACGLTGALQAIYKAAEESYKRDGGEARPSDLLRLMRGLESAIVASRGSR